MADLAALLDQEASAEIEAVTSEAQLRASEILAQANDDAEALLDQRERSATAQQGTLLVRARSAAQLEAASVKLQAQQQAIDTVFADATARLDALANDAGRFRPVLAALFQEALSAVGSPADIREIVVNPADTSTAGDIAQQLGVQAQVRGDADIVAGVRLLGSRNIAIENTLHGRLAALRDDLAAEVARALSGEDGG